ncbi:MAG TPA: DUF6599 family protein [Bryobacteraceae bacterium]|jgi:hypothetical protein
MPRRSRLILACLLFSTSLFADDAALWHEFGLVRTDAGKQGSLSVTRYRMKDVTGALAAWEWLRSPQGRPCEFAPFCTVDGQRTVINDDNYIVIFDGGAPTKAQVESELKALPDKKDTSLPAILSYLPRQGLTPDSARYVLGPASLAAFAPELASANPGFEQGAEAQVASYQLNAQEQPIRLALFYYATPEMARLHVVDFKLLGNVIVKRSDVLVAVVFGSASEKQADTLLSRVQYEAKITWNETPPPGPIKPLFQLLKNIIYLSVLLSALGLTAGLLHAGTRMYRRRFGTLDADEALTTLHLN